VGKGTRTEALQEPLEDLRRGSNSIAPAAGFVEDTILDLNGRADLLDQVLGEVGLQGRPRGR
jgi:hypothetical protein